MKNVIMLEDCKVCVMLDLMILKSLDEKEEIAQESRTKYDTNKWEEIRESGICFYEDKFEIIFNKEKTRIIGNKVNIYLSEYNNKNFEKIEMVIADWTNIRNEDESKEVKIIKNIFKKNEDEKEIIFTCEGVKISFSKNEWEEINNLKTHNYEPTFDNVMEET
ncbi:MAG: hypothetical protein ACRC4M_04300 [Mycoplasma sp.]